MSLTRFCFAGLLFLACHTAVGQVSDEVIVSPRARKGAAQPASKPAKTTNAPLPGDELPRRPPRQNTDLIDDLSPEQKRAAEEGNAVKSENAIPDSLGEALSRALHHSPAVLVADAKLRQAQAELNEVRQSVVHDLTLAFRRWSKYKIPEDEAKIIYLLGAAVGAPERMYLKSERATNDPEGMSAIGVGGMSPMGAMPGSPMPGYPPGYAGMAATKAATKPAPGDIANSKAFQDLPENVRSFLNKRIDLDFAQQPLEDVLAYIQQAADGDVDFVLQNPDVTAADALGPPVTIVVKKVTVAAALQALADLNGSAFIFRDYGILVIGPKDNARSLESYRASGARMIAPPEQPLHGVGGMMAPGMMGGPPVQ